MFHIISNKVLDEDIRKKGTRKDKRIARAKAVVDALGGEYLWPDEIYSRLVAIKALPDNRYGRWLLKLLIGGGFPGEHPRLERYFFVPYNKYLTDGKYRVMLKWVDIY